MISPRDLELLKSRRIISIFSSLCVPISKLKMNSNSISCLRENYPFRSGPKLFNHKLDLNSIIFYFYSNQQISIENHFYWIPLNWNQLNSIKVVVPITVLLCRTLISPPNPLDLPSNWNRRFRSTLNRCLFGVAQRSVLCALRFVSN